jgi:hypothetical protein
MEQNPTELEGAPAGSMALTYFLKYGEIMEGHRGLLDDTRSGGSNRR